MRMLFIIFISPHTHHDRCRVALAIVEIRHVSPVLHA